MFINKRKKIINSVFGELEYRNLMYHGETQITLWDKTFDIKVFPVTNSKSKEITPKQERAYEYFLKNTKDIQKKIEGFLKKICETQDTNLILTRYEPYELIFDLNGGFGLEIIDNVTDDEYDSDLVIIILPDLGIDTSDHYLSNAICDDYIGD